MRSAFKAMGALEEPAVGFSAAAALLWDGAKANMARSDLLFIH